MQRCSQTLLATSCLLNAYLTRQEGYFQIGLGWGRGLLKAKGKISPSSSPATYLFKVHDLNPICPEDLAVGQLAPTVWGTRKSSPSKAFQGLLIILEMPSDFSPIGLWLLLVH